MGDFKIFLDNVTNGNLNGVINCFQPHFLEKEDLWKGRPIHYACSNGHLEIVKFLVKNKCSIECQDEDEMRPIHYACRDGHLEIVKFLVQNNCCLEYEDKDKWRPIHYACRESDLKIVKFLVQNNCCLECEDKDGWRPIHRACQCGNLDVLTFLCENKSELDGKTKDGETPAEVARRNGKKDCENYLDGILKFCPRNIFECIRMNDVQALDVMYSPTIFKMEDHETGLLILEVAVQSNAKEIITYLLNKLINNEEISTLKDYMKNCCRPDSVQLFQESLLYRSIRLHDAEGFHNLSKAKTINEHRKLIKPSFLEIAAQFGSNAFIEVLLKKSIYNEEEWTKAMELAIVKGHAGIAEAISDRKRLLKKRAEKSFTWLHSAVCDNDPDMVKYILERHLVNPNFNNEVVGTALALSHMMCYEKCIEIFENFNVDVNTQNRYLQSPLHEAISSGMTDHCSYLISRTDYIDRPGFMGFTGLQCAVTQGCEKLCDELVKNGADCSRYVEIIQPSAINNTVLPISKSENSITLCMKIHEKIYPCFLEKMDGDMMKCCDGNKNSLLHMAVKCLQPDLCSTLINCGLNVEAINDQGKSPLFELFSSVDNKHDNVAKAIETLNILVQFGIDLNTTSKCGITVLKGASQWNSERLMVSLLSKQSRLTCVTETDFKLAFTKQWFEYATTLISIMTEDCVKSVITEEIFSLAILHGDSKLLMSLFMKSTATLQQLFIEDLLHTFAVKDEYEEFLNLLKIEITMPKCFANGETLFTSFLKNKNFKYCWAIINCAANQRCMVLSNKITETPLQICIESDFFDLINPLILICDDELHQFNWHDPLILLFQKLSKSKNNEVDHKLLAAINAIICRGGNIYKKTPEGEPIINYCTRFRERIEIFQSKEQRKAHGMRKICSVCLDNEVNCAFDCGHTFCMDCADQLYRCKICNSEVTKRIEFYFK